MRSLPWQRCSPGGVLLAVALFLVSMPTLADPGGVSMRHDAVAAIVHEETALLSPPPTDRDMFERLVLCVVRIESNYSVRAVSSKGALGLMQVLPSTARHWGVRERARLFDPRTNLRVGIRHLHSLLVRYGGNVAAAVAAYHSGARTVDELRLGPRGSRYVRLVLDCLARSNACRNRSP